MLRGDAVKARQLHVVHPVRDAQRVDDGGARDDEDRGIRKRFGERLRDEQRTVYVPESEGIVGVKKNFGTDRPGRLHRHLDSGERRAASRDLYALLRHRGIVP